MWCPKNRRKNLEYCYLRVPSCGVQAGLRVTEQGEMVHSKFGTPDIAQVTMESFTTAVLEVRISHHELSSPHCLLPCMH